MLLTWRQARVLLSVYYAYMLEYRAEILLWTFANLFPLILMGLWMEVGRQSPGMGMPPEQFVRYFLLVFIVRQFTVVWVIYEFEFHVSEGRLSPLLLQPVDPWWRFMAMHLAERAARAPFAAGIVALVFALCPRAMWMPGPQGLVLGILAIQLAFMIRFAMQYCVSMAAFWTERASAFEELLRTPYLFLSGMVIPLELCDPVVRKLAYWTPFPYLVYVPVHLIVDGTAGPDVTIPGAFAVMLAWFAGFHLLSRWLWRLGLRRYSAMGA